VAIAADRIFSSTRMTWIGRICAASSILKTVLIRAIRPIRVELKTGSIEALERLAPSGGRQVRVQQAGAARV
jgi:hypothetical protein